MNPSKPAPDGDVYLSVQLVMRKQYFLLSILAAIAPANAALVIEPELAPAHIPYAPVAAPAPYLNVAPNAGSPANGAIQLHQFFAQPIAIQPSKEASVQATPTAAQPALDADPARQLLADDAAKAIGQHAPKLGTTPTVRPQALETKSKGAAPEATSTPDIVKTHVVDGTVAEKSPSVFATGPVVRGRAVPVPISPDGDLFSAWRPQPTKDAEAEQRNSSALNAPAPLSVKAPLEQWNVSAGGSLENTINEWAVRAGWRVEWATDLNYPMVAPFTIEGEFLEAISAIFNAYSQAERSFRVEAFDNQVLVVSEKK